MILICKDFSGTINMDKYCFHLKVEKQVSQRNKNVSLKIKLFKNLKRIVQLVKGKKYAVLILFFFSVSIFLRPRMALIFFEQQVLHRSFASE